MGSAVGSCWWADILMLLLPLMFALLGPRRPHALAAVVKESSADVPYSGDPKNGNMNVDESGYFMPFAGVPPVMHNLGVMMYDKSKPSYLEEEKYRPPKETYEPPKETYEPPTEKYEPPKEIYEPPKETYEPPKET